MVKKELTPPLTPEEFTRSYAKIEKQKGLSLDEIHTTAQKEDIYINPQKSLYTCTTGLQEGNIPTK